MVYGGLILSGCHQTQRSFVLAAEAKVGEPFNPQVFAKAAAIVRSWRVRFGGVRLRYLDSQSNATRSLST